MDRLRDQQRSGVMNDCNYCRRGETQPQCEHCLGTGNEPRLKRIVVWVCPKCESYYAASSAGDLTAKPKHDFKGEERGSQADCGWCRTPRERLTVTIRIPVRERQEVASGRNA